MQIPAYEPEAMCGGKSAQKKSTFVHLKVALDTPKDDETRQTLINYLDKMRCNGLLAVPWGFFDHPELATELIGKPGDWYEGSFWANPDHWQADYWRSVYDFSADDVTVVERVDE